MYTVKVNSKKEVRLNADDLGNLDIIRVKENTYHLLKEHVSYNIEVLSADYKSKQFILLVNGNKYQVDVKDKFDELLRSFGMDIAAGSKINEIKAPMPGLVIEAHVKNGDEVKKGDPVITLEAMKMENILKSPADGKIKAVNVKKGQAVEKNQVLIQLD
jgi:biotin carboxyl carrier protein